MWEELSRAGATERASGAGEQTSISLTDGDLHSFFVSSLISPPHLSLGISAPECQNAFMGL